MACATGGSPARRRSRHASQLTCHAGSHHASLATCSAESPPWPRLSMVKPVVLAAVGRLATCGSRRPHDRARQPGTPEKSYCRLGPAVQPRSEALEPLRGAAQHADFAAFDDHPGRADARGRRLLPRALRSRQGGGRRERGGPLLLPAGRRRRRAEHRVAARQPRAQAGSGAALERRRQRQRRRGRRRRRLRAQQLRGRQRVCGQRGGDVAVGGGAPRGLALPCARRSATPRRDDACTSGLVAAAAHLRNEC